MDINLKGRSIRIIDILRIYKDNFWNLVSLNLLYTIFSIPAIVASFCIVLFLIQPKFSVSINFDFIFRIIISIYIWFTSLVALGPVQAGFSYCIRTIASNDVINLWSDFKENSLKNFKQSIILSSLDLIVIIFVAIYLNILNSLRLVNPTMFLVVASSMGIFLFLYTMLHIYIFPLMVTFNLRLRDILINSIYLSLIGIFKNILLLVLEFVIISICFLVFKPIIGGLLIILVVPSFLSFINMSYTFPTIKKYLIKDQ